MALLIMLAKTCIQPLCCFSSFPEKHQKWQSRKLLQKILKETILANTFHRVSNEFQQEQSKMKINIKSKNV